MGLNPEQLKEIADAFNVFDMDKDGVISLKEMEGVLKTLGHYHSKSATQEMFKQVDKDGSGNIEFEEFLELIKNHLMYKGNPLDELQNIFQYFDLDSDGFISNEELKKVLNLLSEMDNENTTPVNDEDIEDMIKLADKNKDGKVDLSEFLELMNEIDDINLTHSCKHAEEASNNNENKSSTKRRIDKNSRNTFRRNFNSNDRLDF